MMIFLIRHAAALHDTGTGDEYRQLTEIGCNQTLSLAKCCNALGVGFDQIWTSNLLRAEGTAERLAYHLTDSPPVILQESLIPPGDFNGLRMALRKSTKDSIALVGHMPFIGQCLQYWVTENAHPGIDLGLCSMVALDAAGFNRNETSLKFVINDFLARGVAALSDASERRD